LEDFATEKASKNIGLSSKDPMSDQNEPEKSVPEEVPVSIRLDQFLQLCGVSTGGQAKLLIQGGEITVNGEVETRRRKKLVPGDDVGFDGEIFSVELEQE